MEAPNADLTSVKQYFETQIARAEAVGLPGPGCFVANSATEVAPRDVDVMTCVQHHNDRLRTGFTDALTRSSTSLSASEAAALAELMVIFTNGLWTMSRSVGDAGVLRRAVETFLNILAENMK